ncbi:hypothetical protein [Niveispirillum fermenti]|uniref:hypothetical protein n=1 Tax=Niveispirillum fermenti TaxID=1233113 RepID=UPI003A83E9CC
MSGTNAADWAYLVLLVGAPILFAIVMIYVYTRRRTKRPPPIDWNKRASDTASGLPSGAKRGPPD